MSKIASSKGKTSSLAMLAVWSAASLCSFSSSVNAVTDPVVFTFSTVGDTRQDPSSPDPTTLLPPPPATGGALLPQDAQWLQNTRAWARILRTVQSQKANLLFVNGDMIMGYGRAAVPPASQLTTPTGVVNSDLVKFYTQYAYWRGMVANSLETGTYVVPVPGNHETQCSSKVTTNGTYNFGATPTPSGCMKGDPATGSTTGKFAYVENENAWRANMGDLIGDLSANVRFQSVVGLAPLNASGLTDKTAPGTKGVGGDTSITTDQSKLSYSFDVNTVAGRLHFAVINTDAAGFDSHAPVGWLASDLATAKSNGATKFFVFGHKPAFTYQYLQGSTLPPAGLDNDTNPDTGRDAFWKLIAQYNATYFCGHEHTTKIDQHLDPTNTYNTMPWQVLVGSGGSPFDPKSTDVTVSPSTDRSYIWATVRVHQSGAVTLDSYGFDNGFGPTTAIQSINHLQ